MWFTIFLELSRRQLLVWEVDWSVLHGVHQGTDALLRNTIVDPVAQDAVNRLRHCCAVSIDGCQVRHSFFKDCWSKASPAEVWVTKSFRTKLEFGTDPGCPKVMAAHCKICDTHACSVVP